MKHLTYNIKTQQAKLFKDEVSNPDNLFYVFAGKPSLWKDENAPDRPSPSIQSVEYDVYDNMVFGKRIHAANISLMIRRNDWTYNTIYDTYDNADDQLGTKNFFVTVESVGSFHTFVCLDNNFGVPSLYAPSFEETSPDETFYFTADGYQWKYLFSIPAATFNKFATSTHIPFIENVDVTANSIPGAIEAIAIVDRGRNYTSYANGFFQEIAVNGNNTVLTIDPLSSANTDFYRGSAIKIVAGPGAGQQRTISEYVVAGGQKRVVIDKAFNPTATLGSKYEISPRVEIIGDGFDCRARALINPSTNAISYIEVSNTGFGYSYANASIVGNSNVIVSNTSIDDAQLRVIFGPPKGLGGDVPKTLLCDTVGISIEFSNTELDTIPANNKFRTVGIIASPLFANVEIDLTNIVGTFVDGESVSFEDVATTGVVTFYDEASTLLRLNNINGPVASNTVVRGNTSNAAATVQSYFITGVDKSFDTFDQRLRLGIEITTPQTFIQNDKITQHQTFANAQIESSNSTFMGVTNVRGTFNTSDINDNFSISGTNGATANVNAILLPDLKKNSGEVLYIENLEPVQRSDTTTETIKLSVSFNTK